MENGTTTTAKPDLEHPEDAQYIWLPIAVLLGVFILAGLVYAMSRIRLLPKLINFKRRAATRYGYVSVEEEDSDVSMAAGDNLSERNSIPSLLNARLHISPENRQQQVHADDVAICT